MSAFTPNWKKVAHKHCTNHVQEINDSFQCGCFHCQSFFKPSKIKEWLEDEGTAFCPKCGIDSVIGDASPFDIDEKFLKEMNTYWF